MKGKINIHNFLRNDAFIILMFAVMSMVSVIVVWHSHYVGTGVDLAFHWKRIYEIHDAILQGNIMSKVSLNTFNQTGSAVMSLYPNLNIYSIAFLSLFIKSFVNLYCLIWIFRNFFSLILGYYACRSFTNNKKISFIFSLSYTLSTVTLYFQTSTLMGMSSSIIFMPLILFGFLNLLERNKWIELTIGMSGIILCHVLDTLIVLLFLLIMVIINYKKICFKDTLKSFGKSLLVTLLVTSIFWIPFLILMITNNIGTPPFPSHDPISGQPLHAYLSPIMNHIRPYLSLASLVGLVLSVVLYKELNRLCNKLLWVSVIFLLLCSKLFPWKLFHHTFIENTLQTTFRPFIIPELLLSYLFAVLIIVIFNTEKSRLIVLICVTIAVLLTQLMGQITLTNGERNSKELIHNYDGTGSYIISKNSSFNFLINGYTRFQYDYYPKSSIKMYNTINRHLATYDGNKHIKMKLLGNGGYEFSNKAHIKEFSLPFLYYKGINYQVKLDGKTVDGFANKNSLMTIRNVNKGQHHVRIIVHNTKMQIVSYITSLIGLIILLGAVIRKYILRK